ncbi:hypothetical protein OKW12_005584 [Pseudomonas silensiensis]|jgi:hypothetical protein|uniref:Uncharacterized protein n=1 Tax=Pseudomonas fluorescens TaxID=294 RepID=A0A5E7MXK5_PSEFL|nr:hypothetical protein [Pseudomonas silensiensis]VVP29389.1 hypothetical protein PS870_04238 [Pseudomonas fluorescens]
MIVPTLRVGMQSGTVRVPAEADAERPLRHSHAERGHDRCQRVKVSLLISAPGNNAEAVARWL